MIVTLHPQLNIVSLCTGGTHRMAIALAAARLAGMQIVIVPRGSTIATAIAADAHDG